MQTRLHLGVKGLEPRLLSRQREQHVLAGCAQSWQAFSAKPLGDIVYICLEREQWGLLDFVESKDVPPWWRPHTSLADVHVQFSELTHEALQVAGDVEMVELVAGEPLCVSLMATVQMSSKTQQPRMDLKRRKDVTSTQCQGECSCGSLITRVGCRRSTTSAGQKPGN
eukprot:2683829-Amphidinium_carterae.1